MGTQFDVNMIQLPPSLKPVLALQLIVLMVGSNMQDMFDEFGDTST